MCDFKGKARTINLIILKESEQYNLNEKRKDNLIIHVIKSASSKIFHFFTEFVYTEYNFKNLVIQLIIIAYVIYIV